MAAFPLGLAVHAATRPGLELHALERDGLAAIDATPEVGIVHTRKRVTDSAQLLQFTVGASEFDLTVGVALRRVVSVLLQQLARMLGATGAGLVCGHSTVEFLLAQLQQLLQQCALAGTQGIGHGGCIAVCAAASSRVSRGYGLMAIKPSRRLLRAVPA